MNRSRYPIAAVSEKVQDAARDFIHAIDASVRTTDHCIIFASDLVELCGRLVEQPTTDVHEFVNEMQQIGQQAYDDVGDTLKRFSAVRSTLFQVRVQVMFSMEAKIEKVETDHTARHRRPEMSVLLRMTWFVPQ